MTTIFGIAVFVFIFGGMQRANARRWRHLAKVYAATANEPTHHHSSHKRSMQSLVLLGLGGYNSLKGIVTIVAHKDGVSLRIMAPFALFHAPLYIPYSDIQGWGTSWYLDAKSTELSVRQVPDVKIVMSQDQIDWIRGFAGHQMIVRDTAPPRGKAGQGWRAFALVHAAMGVAILGWFGAHWLSGTQL